MTGASGDMAESRALWRLWTAANEGADAPDAMTLAAYAEDRLPGAERATVAAFLRAHPEIADDVATARLAAEPAAEGDASLAAIVARAAALVAAPQEGVIPFRAPTRPASARPADWRASLRWGVLAASFALVGWVGFSLGNDAYGSLAVLENHATTGVATELLDPPAGFFDLGEASGT